MTDVVRKKDDSPTFQVYKAADFLTASDKCGHLGRGAFAAVRKCEHPNLKQVAVKCFWINGSQQDCDKVLKEISREVKVLSHIDHKNIVKVYGVTAWQQGIYQGIVMEFMEGGNLSSLILLKVSKNIPWKLRLRFCLEIAEGLAYLHYNDSANVFIHGDLKPENILLAADLEVKIADFGAVTIARATGATQDCIEIASTKQHTLPYSAPEFLKNISGKRTREMDIYSMAIIIYEILTRHKAYDEVKPDLLLLLLTSANGLKPNSKFIEDAKSEIKGFPDDLRIFNLLESIMKKCWDLEPANRLSIKQVCQLLRDEHNSLTGLDHLVEEVIKQRKMPPPCSNTDQMQPCESRNCHLNEFDSPFISCDIQNKRTSKELK